uniref:Secreted protein n=1 Tax=Setaria viridis TaxID=4556 RepID=A0A4U6T5D2_SETVI|nr:hypothetical protein SEVIR_9G464050v2 [Setaria viridis]
MLSLFVFFFSLPSCLLARLIRPGLRMREHTTYKCLSIKMRFLYLIWAVACWSRKGRLEFVATVRDVLHPMYLIGASRWVVTFIFFLAP